VVELAEGGAGIGRCRHEVAGPLEAEPKHVADRAVVVDDQDCFHELCVERTAAE
jgi:hypothetical protein